MNLNIFTGLVMIISRLLCMGVLLSVVLSTQSCEEPFNPIEPPPNNQINPTNTHPDLDSAALRTWKWAEITLPTYSWPEATEFGNGLFVDIAHDSTGVKIEGASVNFFLDPVNPIVPTNGSGNFNYRSEIRTTPWQINHPLGTEQWIGWSYTFSQDYKIDETAPITIYQNHPGVNGAFPLFEIEIAGLNRPSPATGGELQVVNGALNERFVTDVKPLAGETVDFVVHVIYGGEDIGLLQIWMNGILKYKKEERTVFDQYAWGGNNKWGIYHHSHRYDSTAVTNTQNSGISHVKFEMGTLRLLKRSPSAPNYGTDAYQIVKP